MKKLTHAEFRSILAAIEDALIYNFEDSYNCSYAELHNEKHAVEVSYNSESGEIIVYVIGNEHWKDFPNLQKLIAESIDTDKILNELRLLRIKSEEMYDAEMETRMHLDGKYGYKKGMYW